MDAMVGLPVWMDESRDWNLMEMFDQLEFKLLGKVDYKYLI